MAQENNMRIINSDLDIQEDTCRKHFKVEAEFFRNEDGRNSLLREQSEQ